MDDLLRPHPLAFTPDTVLQSTQIPRENKLERISMQQVVETGFLGDTSRVSNWLCRQAWFAEPLRLHCRLPYSSHGRSCATTRDSI